MKICLNGKPAAVTDKLSIDQLLKDRNIDQCPVVVEVNSHIVPKETFGTHRLSEDDVVEILRFVGGGGT
jgi:sulfur carrier protein